MALRLVKTVTKNPSQRGAFVPNEDENAKYKKSFCSKLFKNTIFTMYCYVLRFLDFAPYINSEGATLKKLGRLLVTRIFPEYQGIVMEDGSETIGVYAANV